MLWVELNSGFTGEETFQAPRFEPMTFQNSFLCPFIIIKRKYINFVKVAPAIEDLFLLSWCHIFHMYANVQSTITLIDIVLVFKSQEEAKILKDIWQWEVLASTEVQICDLPDQIFFDL